MSSADNSSEKNGDKGTIPKQRLTKLFSQNRDLLLNGTKNNPRSQSNKKVFTPNLNVARNKNADAKVNEKDPKSNPKDRGRNQRNKDFKPNINKRNSNLVQTVGFLSEGIASAPSHRKTYDHSGGSSFRDSNVSDVISKPRVVKRDEKMNKEELDTEINTLAKLLGDESEVDFDDDSKNSSSDDIVPIKIKVKKSDLSSSNVVSAKKEALSKLKVKEEVLESNELGNTSENSLISNGTVIKTEPGLDTYSKEFHRMDPLFKAEPNQLLLFQMPDSLPGRCPEEIKEETTDEKKTQSNVKTSSSKMCTLEHLEEGLIGKLVRYRSGKVKLHLGNSVYDVDEGLTSDFQQNAVVIDANSEQRSANMYSLGSIVKKFNVSPDWEYLFHKMTP